MNRVLVLGAGYSGLMAALRLDRDAQITVVDGRERFAQRIRQHQIIAGQAVRQPRIADLLRPGVRFMQGWVRSIDLARQAVTVETGNGEQRLAYDVLLYALGSQIATGSTPGVAEYAYTVDPSGPRGTAALHAALPRVAARGGVVAVVGGGLTGIETAAELAEAYPGLRVRLVSKASPGPGLSRKGRQHLMNVFAKLGVDVHTGVTVRRVEADALVTADGQRLPVDATIWAASFSVPRLARDAGLAVDLGGRVLVGPDLRSLSHAGVFAIGDAAAVVEADGVPIRMACATAMPVGAHAADNVNALLHGKPLVPFGFRYAFQCISLGRDEALIQIVDGFDRPLERIITGRLGALVKEGICRFTMAALGWERRLPGVYTWPGRQTRPAGAQPSETIAQHG